MNLKGLAALALRKAANVLLPLRSAGNWISIFDQPPGAFQKDIKFNRETVAQNWAVFGCVTLIAGDIGKMPAQVTQYDDTTKIYTPTKLRPVLLKPNRYQTRAEFFKSWVFSLLLHGNTFVLKQRDEKGFVSALYVLHPQRVTPLISPDGGVYYQLTDDYLAQIDQTVVVPASEIIHDRLHTLWHPLIGVSPLIACGIAAIQSSAIQDNSAKFFQNMSRPSGILTAPGAISDETAQRLKATWEKNYGGGNIGRVAVLGDALDYKAMTISAVDAQLIEQLKFSGEMICATFHVPAYKLGLGPMPTVNNTGSLNQQYYDQCLQPIVENIELHLAEGLEVAYPYDVCMDTDNLLRMDPAARYDAHTKGVGGGWLAPNEARQEEDLAPVPGGNTPYLQVQNYSLAALAKRDATADPFGKAPPPSPAPQPTADDAKSLGEFQDTITKGLKWAA